MSQSLIDQLVKLLEVIFVRSLYLCVRSYGNSYSSIMILLATSALFDVSGIIAQRCMPIGPRNISASGLERLKLCYSSV